MGLKLYFVGGERELKRKKGKEWGLGSDIQHSNMLLLLLLLLES